MSTIKDPVAEVRALLEQFAKSSCSDLFVRSGDLTVFMARPDGGVNPMREQAAPVATVAPTAPASPVTAPHLGLFEPACSAGDTIAAGGRIGAIDVLGRKTEVVAESGGRVSALHAASGDLVEFGDTLLELAAA